MVAQNMKIKRIAEYLLGIDILKAMQKRERNLMCETDERLGHPALPVEANLETAVRIYSLRARFLCEYPLKVTARVTGLDYLYTNFIRKQ